MGRHLPPRRTRWEKMAGPKPPDYLIIHKVEGGVRVQVGTHYVNHGGEWTPASGGPARVLEWPKGKGISKFVCIDLEELE